MIDFADEEELYTELTEITDADSLNDFASGYRLPVSCENDTLECSFNCEVDGREATVTITISDENPEFDVWIEEE